MINIMHLKIENKSKNVSVCHGLNFKIFDKRIMKFDKIIFVHHQNSSSTKQNQIKLKILRLTSRQVITLKVTIHPIPS